MNSTNYISSNSKKDRDALIANGYYVCPCCSFSESKWLCVRDETSIEGIRMSVHGVGYPCDNGCEEGCSKKCIECDVENSIYEGVVHIFPDAANYLNYKKHYKE